jgi:O-antigen/teichoic acid export membrane protein
VVSLVATPAITGAYAATYTLFSGAAAAVYSIVQVVLPLRRRVLDSASLSADPVRRVERLGAVAATVAAAVFLVFAEQIMAFLLPNGPASSATWLRLLAPALPLLIFSRCGSLRMIAERNYWGAARVLLLPTLMGIVIMVTLVLVFGPIGGAGGTLIQEALIVVSLLGVRRKTWSPT